eukprot:36865-Eustigmatos_ZCMA.PRE.1
MQCGHDVAPAVVPTISVAMNVADHLLLMALLAGRQGVGCLAYGCPFMFREGTQPQHLYGGCALPRSVARLLHGEVHVSDVVFLVAAGKGLHAHPADR